VDNPHLTPLPPLYPHLLPATTVCGDVGVLLRRGAQSCFHASCRTQCCWLLAYHTTVGMNVHNSAQQHCALLSSHNSLHECPSTGLQIEADIHNKKVRLLHFFEDTRIKTKIETLYVSIIMRSPAEKTTILNKHKAGSLILRMHPPSQWRPSRVTALRQLPFDQKKEIFELKKLQTPTTEFLNKQNIINTSDQSTTRIDRLARLKWKLFSQPTTSWLRPFSDLGWDPPDRPDATRFVPYKET
jgi:hypothetical protein